MDGFLRQNQSPWAVPAVFLALFAGSLLAAAVTSPAAWRLLAPWGEFPIHRVFNRLAMLVFLLGSFIVLRRSGFADRAGLGYAARGPDFIRTAAIGFACGMALIALSAVALTGLSLRTWQAGAFDPQAWLALAPRAILTGCVVGVVEETIFRGALYGGLRSRGSATTALLVTASMYAAVHFLGERTRIAPEAVDWSSGFVLLAGFFGRYRDPLLIVDAFVALLMVGALLALVRERTGHIGGCIGLHAGFVAMITGLRQTSTPDFTAAGSMLISRFDGIVGWLVAVLAAGAVVAAAVLLPRRRGPHGALG